MREPFTDPCEYCGASVAQKMIDGERLMHYRAALYLACEGDKMRAAHFMRVADDQRTSVHAALAEKLEMIKMIKQVTPTPPAPTRDADGQETT